MNIKNLLGVFQAEILAMASFTHIKVSDFKDSSKISKESIFL